MISAIAVPSFMPGPPKTADVSPDLKSNWNRNLPIGKFLFQLLFRSGETSAVLGGPGMKLGTAIAEIMKREGIEILCGYPVNHLIEHAANADIRPIMERQERIGLHMADAISRVTSGRPIGAFCMQHGPGAETAMAGAAQRFGDSVPEP